MALSYNEISFHQRGFAWGFAFESSVPSWYAFVVNFHKIGAIIFFSH